MKAVFISFIGLLVLGACKPKIMEQPFSAGTSNPERFVMIGGGHAAGYMDDGLYTEGQLKSVSSLLAKQLQLVGSGVFNQPLVEEGSIGISLTGLSPLYLGYKTDCTGETALSPVRISSSGDGNILNQFIYSASQPFSNFGIPGMKLSHVAQENYGLSNLFFARMASSSTSSVLSDALDNDPTFFSLLLGIEDVMEFAKSGGTIESLPDESAFYSEYSALVQSLTANGAKGVVATIPDVTQMPYFTTIPYNALDLDSANCATLNAVYNPLGFSFQVGDNPFMIVDSSANQFAVRQILEDELFLLSLPLDSVKCNQMGVLFPIRDEFVLDQAELLNLRAKIDAYNTTIRSLANQYGLAVVEFGEFVNNLQQSFVYNGVTMSTTFVSGGAFSLDGIHLTPRGNALLANEFIKSINRYYGARIPEINAGNYRGALFPQ